MSQKDIAIFYFAMVITVAVGLIVWTIIKNCIIHHKKKNCEHEPVCVCSNGWCFKCDWYKKEGGAK